MNRLTKLCLETFILYILYFRFRFYKYKISYIFLLNFEGPGGATVHVKVEREAAVLLYVSCYGGWFKYCPLPVVARCLHEYVVTCFEKLTKWVCLLILDFL